jgi:prefoldin alpha subunit
MDSQSNAMEMQILQQEYTQLQKNLQAVDQQLVEVDSVQRSLDDFSKLKNGSESLMPLANGIFAKAKIEDTKELLVNVGSNVVVKKSIPETKDLLEQQSKELENYKKEANKQMNEIISKIQELQASLTKNKE